MSIHILKYTDESDYQDFLLDETQTPWYPLRSECFSSSQCHDFLRAIVYFSKMNIFSSDEVFRKVVTKSIKVFFMGGCLGDSFG